MVKVVEMISVKPVMVTQLGPTEDGIVEVRGHVLDKNAGLYAARIVATSNMKKEICVAGPAFIDLNKMTGEFRIQVKAPTEDLFYSQADPKFMEIFVSRRQIEKIKYGAAADASERIQVQHLELCLRLPMEYLPDPRTVLEDEADRQRFEREIADRMKRQEEERLTRIAENLARKEERAK